MKLVPIYLHRNHLKKCTNWRENKSDIRDDEHNLKGNFTENEETSAPESDAETMFAADAATFQLRKRNLRGGSFPHFTQPLSL